jgi:hypothetical protein
MIYTFIDKFLNTMLCKCISNIYTCTLCKSKNKSQNIHDMKCECKFFDV